MPRCVTAVRIIEKSVMGESFVLCPARLDPRLDSRFSTRAGIENRESNGTVSLIYSDIKFEAVLNLC